jgi:hypothetical protein
VNFKKEFDSCYHIVVLTSTRNDSSNTQPRRAGILKRWFQNLYDPLIFKFGVIDETLYGPGGFLQRKIPQSGFKVLSAPALSAESAKMTNTKGHKTWRHAGKCDRVTNVNGLLPKLLSRQHSGNRQGYIFFEAGQSSSCSSVAHGVERHAPGTRKRCIQAEKPIVKASGPYVEYGAVEGPVRPHQ